VGGRTVKKNKDLNYYLSLPYKTETYFVPEDETWVAVHPELGRGSCYAVAETEDAARELLKEEKVFILEYALKNGETIPEPFYQEPELPSGNLQLRIPRSLHQKLKEKAITEGVSLNSLISNSLSEFYGCTKILSELQEFSPITLQWSKSYNFYFNVHSKINEFDHVEILNEWLLEPKNVETKRKEINWRNLTRAI
jgi:antitoxin HicB